MLEVREAVDKDELNAAERLLREYLQLATTRANSEFGIEFDVDSMLEDDLSNPHKFFPPTGRILVAVQDRRFAGVACLKAIDEHTGEIKRMFVRPEFRNKGIGRALVEGSLRAASEIGYERIRLDSAGFMKDAHRLYRSSGFRDIEPYPESEIPPEFQPDWIFMEIELQ